MARAEGEGRKYAVDRFVEMINQVFIRKHEGTAIGADRAILADLRRGFSEGTSMRVWPHLLGPPVNARWNSERDERIWVTVAAVSATTGNTGLKQGNIGASMRNLALADAEGDGKKGDKPLKRMEPHFKRLLVCSSAEELCRFLPGIAKRCGRAEVPVNVTRLFWDLCKWEQKQNSIRMQWAESFWHVPEMAGGAAI